MKGRSSAKRLHVFLLALALLLAWIAGMLWLAWPRRYVRPNRRPLQQDSPDVLRVDDVVAAPTMSPTRQQVEPSNVKQRPPVRDEGGFTPSPTFTVAAPLATPAPTPTFRFERLGHSVSDAPAFAICDTAQVPSCIAPRHGDDDTVPVGWFTAVSGEQKYAGAYALRLGLSRTFLGVEPTGRVSVDKVQARSMEHFKLERVENDLWHMRPVGRDDKCLVVDHPLVTLGSCKNASASMALYRSASPADGSGTAPLRSQVTPTKFALVTTVRFKDVRRTKLILAVLNEWLAIPGVRLVVVTESDEDAATVRTEVPGAYVVGDSETVDIGGHSIPTYRGLFLAANKAPDARFIMFANSDIVFDPEQVAAVIAAVVDLRRQHRDRHIFVTGRRWNCDVSAAGDATEAIRSLSRDRCELFGDDAQDYFLVTRGAFRWNPDAKWARATPATALVHGRPYRDLVDVPALVVGGIAFDNFIVALANKRPDVISVDATAAIDALHLNHGSDSRESHRKPSSIHNSKLAHESGGWARGKTTLCPYTAIRWGKQVLVHERGRLLRCGNCTLWHFNEHIDATDPPDAFSRPWKRPD